MEKRTLQGYKCFCARIGKWRASDVVPEIKDKVYLLPTINYYFNSTERYVSFSFLTFTSYFLFIDYTKKDKRYY